MSAAERIEWSGRHPADAWAEGDRTEWWSAHPVLLWSHHPCDEVWDAGSLDSEPANDNRRRLVALATPFPEQPTGAAAHQVLPSPACAERLRAHARGEAQLAQARVERAATNASLIYPRRASCGRGLTLYIYDVVGNPVEIRDWRDPDEWPVGAKPVTKKIEYDDLYRATRIKYEYAQGDDTWQSPFQAEVEAEADDPRQAAPSPHIQFQKRILEQTFEYDWVGNNEKTGDDANGFYDRSLGSIDNDDEADKPYQLKGATLAGPSGGSLQARYDSAGYMTAMALLRSGTCIGGTASGDCNQQFVYEWDEVGRLSRARRFDNQVGNIDTFDASAAGTPDADLRHTYDASDQRVIKHAVDAAGVSSFTLYVFESLELRRTQHETGNADDGVASDYEVNHFTVVPYLLANGVRLARVVYHASGDVPEEPYDTMGSSGDVNGPAVSSGKLHVFFELGDHLGSTSVVLDKATGELVERATFQGYGGAESDYRPGRWKNFREDYRFTGKEEDVEVGLQYFGKRYLNPLLGRWVSADPLAVHAPGEADLNVYAYVQGQILKAIDPIGLNMDDIMTRVAFDNTVKGVAAMGGPTKVLRFARSAIRVMDMGLLAVTGDEAKYLGSLDSLYVKRGAVEEVAGSMRTGNPSGGRGFEAMVHESTHAYLDKSSSSSVKKAWDRATDHYASNGHSRFTARRIAEEAISEYAGHKAATWLRTQQELNKLEKTLASGNLSDKQIASAQEQLSTLRQDYNAAMKERVFGYDHLGNETNVAMDDATKKFVDEDVLEGRIDDSFDKQFGSQVQGMEQTISEASSQSDEK